MRKLSELIRKVFPHQPTQGQVELFSKWDVFFQGKPENRPAFVLKGYAGTGKTSVISALVQVLPLLKYRTVLLAPTGRAAKVMTTYSGKKAFTIHKKIYKQVSDADSGQLVFRKQKNLHTNTLFIVDEASMISDESEFGTSSLLADLVSFVFEGNGNKLMFIGDSAQLPPVFQKESIALYVDHLSQNYLLTVTSIELKEVMRQQINSGILHNATQLRTQLEKDNFRIRFIISDYKDIFRMNGEKLEDGLRYAYDKYGIDNTIIICRSNKTAVQYNHFVRNRIFFREEEIDAGDFLMIVRNNYHVLPEDSPAGFLANGDFAEVLRIINIEELYGYRFATLELRLPDFPEQKPFEAKVFLDTLHSPTPSLSMEEYKKLYHAVREDIEQNFHTKKEREKALRKDHYLNALQIKYAYALTCHKSQGGQWKAVFVDQGYLTEEMQDKEYLRWLYTATTRASQELFLMNFHERFFAEEV
ncbi:ATP-dependent DNA helicase [Xanthovirga aplysinae]|uniref:ATP-dependent DNA helicase n=1 Tax=Xanthovirga aplysinae TaxID=2529853 RepID=UPI0012BC066C|nr:AAA family ATPase [Xanthovirga aplysinae]MTI32715.1 ATP-dependent endonuclease [Xanthovirga aplysinae]